MEAKQTDGGDRRSVLPEQLSVNTDWRVSDRLSEADIAKIVKEFAIDTPKSKLAERHKIIQRSAKRLSKKHGWQRSHLII